MKKILVPCDGSQSSLRAVVYAASLAREMPAATVELLHVADPTAFRSPAAALSPGDLSRLCPAQAERVLAPARARLQEAGIVPLIRCRVGAPAVQIAEEETKAACDAIVMGTRGTRALTSLMIGSVASAVVTLVDVPVTLVK